jgi:hypothetical protein
MEVSNYAIFIDNRTFAFAEISVQELSFQLYQSA